MWHFTLSSSLFSFQGLEDVLVLIHIKDDIRARERTVLTEYKFLFERSYEFV